MAVPSITSLDGDFNHLSTVTIAGTGFSTHADFGGFSHTVTDHLALVWKDFEDNVLQSDRLVVEGGRTDHWAILTSGNRTNSAYFGYRFYLTDRFAGLKFTQSSAITTGTYYNTFWMQTPNQTVNCGSKFERLYYGTALSRDNTYFVTGDCGGWGPRATSECASACSPSPSTEFGGGEAFLNNTWHRIDTYRNVADGEVTLWKDMEKIYTKRRDCTGWTDCDTQEWLELANYAPNGRSWDIGHEAQKIPSSPGAAGCDQGAADGCVGTPYNGFWYFDDVYFSYSKAHVELCSLSTWAAVRGANGAVQCEVQIPTSWSSTSIGISLNTGAFSPGTTAYMYVISDQGTTQTDDVNANGFPLVIGESGDGEDPEDPEDPDDPGLPVFDGEGVLIGYDEDD